MVLFSIPSFVSQKPADIMFQALSQNADTCNDGLQNGDETGIDGGGSCVPCNLTCPAPYDLNINFIQKTHYFYFGRTLL